MYSKVKFEKSNIIKTIIISMISVLLVMIITYSVINLDAEVVISSNTNVDSTPYILDTQMNELGAYFDELNENFKQEIDKLTLGVANRHNKRNEEILYGVNSKEHKYDKLCINNGEYQNGINIDFVANKNGRAKGESNFLDILSVMSILYEQKMDVIDISVLKNTMKTLFEISHTYTFNSTELYPCRMGCDLVQNYYCTDVVNNYKNHKQLKYDPFVVFPHDYYEDYDTDAFMMKIPDGKCLVHKSGAMHKYAGCIWEEDTNCYHSSAELKEDTVSNDQYGAYEILDDTVLETVDTYIGEVPDGILGYKIDKKDNACSHFRIVKHCKQIEKMKKQIEDTNKEYDKASEKDPGDNESAQVALEKRLEALQEKINQLERDLETHINEKHTSEYPYWCDGFKVCTGHKTHYHCDGHRLVICYGHTDIFVDVKILYGEDILKALYSRK